MKVALVHDDLVQLGGAERLFGQIANIFPEAPIYTSIVDWEKVPESIDRSRIRTSFLQKIPFVKFFYKAILPFYPMAFESFNFDGFNVVLSSTTRFAKSIITKPKTVHICYINSLPRFLYDQKMKDEYLPKFLQFISSPIFWWLKKVDRVSSARVDVFIANSKNVAKAVKKIYNRDAQVLHPFADTDYFTIKSQRVEEPESQSYFLIVSRLAKWKKIDIAVKACSDLGQRLVVIGTGPAEGSLKGVSNNGKNIEFRGNVSKEELRTLYQGTKALIVTQAEDFGIATVEALACGTPVIAYKAGGQEEIIENKKTGLFFESQTVPSLKDAINGACRLKWESEACRKSSLKFSKAEFVKKLKAQLKIKP